MTENEDENGTSTKGRPNAYFARIREEQEEELAERADTFGGAFRGVKPAPHGGSVNVRPDQIIGNIDLCWCGSPLGHDWPGKSFGAKHPKVEEGSMNTATSTTIDRRDLRAYHRRLQDFILSCVNTDGLRYRVGKNSTILYPKDDSTPMTVHARNTDRQLRQLQKWYVEHVYVAPEEEPEVTPDQIAALAATKNDPVEHPEPPKRPEYQDQPAEPAEYLPPKSYDIPTPQSPGPVSTTNTEEWIPWLRGDGTMSPNIETDGSRYRCKWCEGTDHHLYSDNARSIGGHNRIYHTDTSDMHSTQARNKAVQTTRLRKAQRDKTHQAIGLLIEASGYEVGPPVDTSDLERQVEECRAEAARWKVQYEEANQRAEEVEAKLALIREATGL